MPGSAPIGYIPQYYRDAHGYSFDALLRKLDCWAGIGCSGAMVHGFVGELDATVFNKHAKAINQRGMAAYAAFGLNSINPESSARWIATIAKIPSCAGVVFDMEGAWEDEGADKAKAKILGDAFRDAAPDVWAADQPWPVPTLHWSRFPWEEIAAFVDARAPQYYYNNWTKQWGRQRYAKCNKWFDDAWQKLDARLQKSHHNDPVLVTLQGYGWDDIFADLVDALLRFPTAFIWAEPFPSIYVEEALLVVRQLKDQGFTGPYAVMRFQEEYNRNRLHRLVVDGRCGTKETAPAILGRAVRAPA